jgi:Mn2+/Fe2+ NRAMP family transporter
VVLCVSRHLGPGFIITATIVESADYRHAPSVGASVGFSLLWFIVLGCVLKVFVQIQLARTAVATGRTTLDALNALPARAGACRGSSGCGWRCTCR